MVGLMSPEELRELTPWDQLIDALGGAFRQPCQLPDRVHWDISGAGSLLVMPAWQKNGLLGVKVVQAFPGNSDIGKPTVDGTYMLASAATGEVYSLIDARELTARRTAATSALASRFLSRGDSRCLLVMGTGRLAFEVICAHASVRPIERVLVWGRSHDKAQLLASRVSGALGVHAQAVSDLSDALPHADIISTVTASPDPILQGRHLHPGAHVDLIGGFTQFMREADDDVMRMSSVYVDMVASALREAGDIADPLERGVILRSDIRGDLFDLCCGRVSGRASEQEVTLFKSVGIALEDLATATLAWNTLQGKGHAYRKRS
jgi:ornithine cyclodeaminase